MGYIDKEYFLTKIKEVDLNNLIKDDSGSVQIDYLNSAIKAADNMIDSYISAVAVLPLNTIPDMIMLCSYKIAMNILHDRIDPNDKPDFVKAGYEEAMQYLDAISRGDITLNIPANEMKNNGINYQTGENIFNNRIM